jgi:hypothetical protein
LRDARHRFKQRIGSDCNVGNQLVVLQDDIERVFVGCRYGLASAARRYGAATGGMVPRSLGAALIDAFQPSVEGGMPPT